MARLLKSSFGLRIDLEGNVGINGGNARTDVGAVQYALLLLSSGIPNPMGGKTGGGLAVPGQGTIAVDGFYGQQTAAYIKAYQEKRAMLPSPSLGMLPKPTGNFDSFRRSSWSLGLLQSDVQVTLGDLLTRMSSDPRCPPFLREAFFA